MPSGNVNVTRSSMPSYEEYCAEIAPLWETRWLTNCGSIHNKLIDGLKGYLDVDNLTLFTNGHMALEILLQALVLEGEVITTPFTFASTTHAIVRSGLTPVFCDIREDNYTIDPSKIEALITPRTSAILPVHVYGNMCDVDAIQRIADEHGLKVVYDAAHVFGVRRKGAGAGSFGDASMFSFHATKVFHTIEGGAITAKDPQVIERAEHIRNFGLAGDDAAFCGPNAKMNEFAAAMGICNLRHVDEEIAKRAEAAERYLEHLDGVAGLKPWRPDADVQPNYAYFPVLVNHAVFGATRDGIFDALSAQGITARRYFYPLTSDFSCYRGVFDPGETPVARAIASNVICLPLYAGLERETVDRVCSIVLKARS